MYLKKIRCVNTGPIDDVVIEMPFDGDRPKPIVVVGENGTGKSELLSFVVDSLYEIAGESFKDVREKAEDQGYQYYKAITPIEIKTNSSYMYSYVEYKNKSNSNDEIGYFLKSGDLPIDDFRKNSGFKLANNVDWAEESNYKKVFGNNKVIQKVFERSVFCYFSPNRYEMPIWMGDKYYEELNLEYIKIGQRWSHTLGRTITADNSSNDNIHWLLDIIADSRCDVKKNNAGGLYVANISTNDLLLLNKARENIEIILSRILQEEVYFGLNLRNDPNLRFNIKRKSDNSIFAPSLKSLSTGQLALFNLFTTIVRYADWNDIYNSIDLKKISGIVVIDEIELHLHADLQRDILPELIKLFPGIQFIISTHSPLFLLGMDDIIGDSNYQIIEMPKGKVISSEAYSQFQNAYAYFKETKQYQNDISNAINNSGEKPLIITEGSTDWKHMKAALTRFQSEGLFNDLDIEFLEYEPINKEVDDNLQLEMNNSQLIDACKGNAIINKNRKLIFIADADDDNTSKEMSTKDNRFKNWGNNVYSFVLPIPLHRKDTPKICIEHLYEDSDLKKPMIIDGIERRLYMGNEFDRYGHTADNTYYCSDRNSCGPDKIKIIDGNDGKVVFKLTENTINLALPKAKFASAVLSGQEGFNNLNINGFSEVFKIIDEIVKL